MRKARDSVSDFEVANSVQNRSMTSVQPRQRGDLPQQTRNSRDSGFTELTGVGERVKAVSNTCLSFGKYYLDSEVQAKQTTGTGDADVSSIEDSISDSDISAEDMATSHQKQYSTCPPQVRGSDPISNDSQFSVAYSEFTEIKESSKDEEKEVQRVYCPPQPLPRFVIVRPPRPSIIMLKWPMSYGRFLKVIENINRPKITIDNYSKEFKRQYCFIAETEVVIDIDDNCHYLMCFRYDMYGKSFYLVPQSTSSPCPETLKLVFDEANKKIVMEPPSDTNSKFWFTYKEYPFPFLASLSHPMYYLSLEKGYKVLLRDNKGRQPDTRNFNIQVLGVIPSNVRCTNNGRSLFKTLSRAITSLSCTNKK